jgi:LysM repeat protein
VELDGRRLRFAVMVVVVLLTGIIIVSVALQLEAMQGLPRVAGVPAASPRAVPTATREPMPWDLRTATSEPSATAAATASPTPAPTPPKGPVPVPSPTATPTHEAPVYHTVQPGENLFRIGLRYGVSVGALAEANCITNPRLVIAGSRLLIPDPGQTVSRPP